MKIKIPKIYEDVKLTDPDIVIIAMMTIFGEKKGFENYYNFNALDIKKIYGNRKERIEAKHKIFNSLREVFDIAVLDEWNWALRFNKENYEYIPTRKGSRDKARTAYKVLTCERSIRIYCYILGRIQTQVDIIDESQEFFYHKQTETKIVDALLTSIRCM